MKKEKINFLDVLRFAAFGMIIFYHMVVRLHLCGCYELSKVEVFYSNRNIHLGSVGVILFFFISGLGLMLSAKNKFNLKNYFSKRFFKILLPFYVAYLMVFTVYSVIERGFSFFGNIPLWRFVFTVVGLDGYLYEYGFPTFYLIGEWFLGCIILMYVLFPIIRKSMLKHRSIIMLVFTVGYLFLAGSGSDVWYVEFLCHLYVFVLGMYMAFYLNRLKRWHLVVSVPVICILLFWPVELPMIDVLRNFTFAMALFVSLSQLEVIFSNCDRFMKFIRMCCRYSFEIYLIHHVIIIYFTRRMAAKIHSLFDVIVVFVFEIILMIILAVIIKFITAIMKNFILQKSAKQEKN